MKKILLSLVLILSLVAAAFAGINGVQIEGSSRLAPDTTITEERGRCCGRPHCKGKKVDGSRCDGKP